MSAYACTVDEGDTLDVAETLDGDDDLRIQVTDGEEVAAVYLARDDVARLWDQLGEILGEAAVAAADPEADPLPREVLVEVLEIVLGRAQQHEAALQILRRFG